MGTKHSSLNTILESRVLLKLKMGRRFLGLRSLPGLRNELLLLGPFNDDITQQSVSVACGSDAHEAHM
jgi:hypothetical protein